VAGPAEGLPVPDASGNFEPPRSVAANARRALDVRAEASPSERGLTTVGIRRAAQLANRQPVSIPTMRRILGYLSRHLVDKRGATWDEQGKGWVAWHAWGGDEAGRWAARELARFDPDWYAEWAKAPRNRALLRHLRG